MERELSVRACETTGAGAASRLLAAVLAGLSFFVIVAWVDSARAQTDPCAERGLRQLIADYNGKIGVTSGEPKSWVQAGGATADIRFDKLDPGSLREPLVCAGIVWKPKGFGTSNDGRGFEAPAGLGEGFDACIVDKAAELLPVLSLTGGSDAQGNARANVRLRMARAPRFAPGTWSSYKWCDAILYVVIYEKAATGDGLVPKLGFRRLEWISHRWQGWASVLPWLIFAVAAAAGSGRAIRRRSPRGSSPVQSGWRSWIDPVIITSAGSGRASLSSLQVFVFTLIVGGMLAFMVGRFGNLAELSVDVLYLLGISAVGAGAAKATDNNSRRGRLSFRNWVWLKSKKWPLRPEHPGWGELLSTTGQFDITKFQMLIFSILVAAALLAHGAQGLASFEIPASLLGILGLSQVTYLGGKFIKPPTVNEYDDTLNKLIEAETQFADALVAEAGAKTKTGSPAAAALRPPFTVPTQKAYEAFRSLARKAAAMHETIVGEKVPEDKLEPALPSDPAAEPAAQPTAPEEGG